MGVYESGVYKLNYTGDEIDLAIKQSIENLTIASAKIHSLLVEVPIPAAGASSTDVIPGWTTAHPGKSVGDIIYAGIEIFQSPNRDTISGYGIITASGTLAFAQAYKSGSTGLPYYFLYIPSGSPPTGNCGFYMVYTLADGT